MADETPLPDPQRLGGIAWLERTGGRLTRAEQRRLVAAIVRTEAELAAGWIRLVLGRRPEALPGVTGPPDPPDSALARGAEAACLELAPFLVAHSYRTWIYSRVLAAVDRASVDPELAYVAGLVHDAGLGRTVPGEDFTLRSADRAARVMVEAGASEADVAAVRDAISVHTLPGAAPATDGALGAYLQAGAMLDLVGLRAWDLPADLVASVTQRHPVDGLVGELVRGVRAEAAAVPDGRFALVRRWGLSLAVRVAPRG